MCLGIFVIFCCKYFASNCCLLVIHWRAMESLRICAFSFAFNLLIHIWSHSLQHFIFKVSIVWARRITTRLCSAFFHLWWRVHGRFELLNLYENGGDMNDITTGPRTPATGSRPPTTTPDPQPTTHNTTPLSNLARIASHFSQIIMPKFWRKVYFFKRAKLHCLYRHR